MQIACLALFAIGLQVGVGWLGHGLYPCGWMRPVLAVCLLLETAAVITAAVDKRRVPLKRSGRERCMLAQEEVKVWLLWTGMMVNALVFGAAAGAVCDEIYIVINTFSGVALVMPLLSFVMCWPSTAQLHSRRNELRRTDYPLIQGLLVETAKVSGHSRRLKLFLGDGTACAFVEFGYDGIIISPLFLTILTRDELRQVFLHEIAHLTDLDTRREIRWRRLAARQACVRLSVRSGWMELAAAPVLYAAMRFGSRLEEYLKKVEPQRERKADARTAELGEANHAAAAVAKAEFVERFLETCGGEWSGMAALREEYKGMIAKHGGDWLAELENQTEMEGEPHPCFRERCKAAQFNPFLVETDGNWLRETDRLCALADRNRKLR